MAEFVFEVKIKNHRYPYNRFINYEDINKFTVNMLKECKVRYKLCNYGEYSKTVLPTNWDRVAKEIKSVIIKFFDDNIVHKRDKGTSIYLEYFEKEDRIDVSVEEPSNDSNLLAVIDWYVC